MLKTNLTISLLMTIFLSGCQTPEVRDLLQKSARLVLIYDAETGRRYVDEQESGCFVRMYRHTKEYVGSITSSEERDILECNKVIGYGPRDYGDLALFKEEIRRKLARK